jgi:hypothetical protein
VYVYSINQQGTIQLHVDSCYTTVTAACKRVNKAINIRPVVNYNYSFSKFALADAPRIRSKVLLHCNPADSHPHFVTLESNQCQNNTLSREDQCLFQYYYKGETSCLQGDLFAFKCCSSPGGSDPHYAPFTVTKYNFCLLLTNTVYNTREYRTT